MVELPLSRNMFAIIDDEDYELVGGFKWYAKDFRNGTYAARNEYTANGTPPKTVLLHRVIMGADAGEYVDHISRDTLDNRRGNLRKCTNAQNMWNQKVRSNNTSGYKGVSFHPVNKNWTSSIMVNGKVINKCGFKTKEEAARCYNDMAKKYHGEFARLNIITNQIGGV